MDLTLKRSGYLKTGIFGLILDSATGIQHFVSLEHAYAAGAGFTYVPKIPAGAYLCRRGMHQLEHMTEPFETFEVVNVPGHSNCLFHVGNYNSDSQGCILVGEALANDEMITNSREAFEDFMSLQQGLDEFQLAVIS